MTAEEDKNDDEEEEVEGASEFSEFGTALADLKEFDCAATS